MKRKVDISYRQLNAEHVDVIIDYERQYLIDPAICMRSDKECIKKCLESGFSIGAFVDDILVGFTLAYHTEYAVAFVEKCFVLPSYRGYGIQLSTLERALKLIKRGCASDIYTMVSPQNMVSIQNFKICGFSAHRSLLPIVERDIMVLHQ